jgi:hypothetical protein
VLKVFREHLVHKVHQDKMVKMVLLDQKVIIKVRKELLDMLVLMGFLVQKETQVLKELLDFKVLKVLLEFRGLLVYRGKLVIRVFRVH